MLFLIKIVSIVRFIAIGTMIFFFISEEISSAIFTGVFVLFSSIWLGHQEHSEKNQFYYHSTSISEIPIDISSSKYAGSSDNHSSNDDSLCSSDGGDCGGGDGGD